MSQAVVDPEELRQFALSLKKFNNNLRERASSTNLRASAPVANGLCRANLLANNLTQARVPAVRSLCPARRRRPRCER